MAKKEPVLVVDSSLVLVVCACIGAYAGVRVFLNNLWGRHK